MKKRDPGVEVQVGRLPVEHPLCTWTVEQQATISAFRLSLLHQRQLVIVSACPSGMTKQQPQSLCAFLPKGCQHVSVQWDSVPAGTSERCYSMEHHHQPVPELCHLGSFCCMQLLRQSTEMHSDCACAAQLPFNNFPARQLGFNFYLATASHPEKPPSPALKSMLWTYFLVLVK